MRIKLQILIYCIYFPVLGFAQTYPAGFAQVLVANGIDAPTAMAFAPDGRIFVTRQNGVLVLIKPGITTPTPILVVPVNSVGERGLLGIAFDPEFTSNQHFYLYYTATTPILHNRISRFTLNGDAVVAGSEQIILDLDALSSASNHNGGGLAFGPDGKLYVAIGENANPAYAQNLNTYHGKILRINKDGSAPADNPFASSTVEQTKRVWAYGVRNPYTISFQPVTGRLFVNDVGQQTWEEINDATVGGKNFGWPASEGPTTDPNFTTPIYYYGRGNANAVGCAITGGTFFNPSSTNYPFPYYGTYFFQDLCSRWINFLNLTVTPAARGNYATYIPASGLYITTGIDGNLYFLSRTARSLYKIIYTTPSPARIVNQPDDLTVLQREASSLSVAAIGALPLAYQWQKNEVNIEGATSPTYSIGNTGLADAGQYRVIVSNTAGKDTSDVATLEVTHVNLKPAANITQPETPSTYVAGTELPFSGTGTDDDDGELGPEAFDWNINFHHNSTVTNQLTLDGISTGTFDIPNEGELSTDVWYRIILTVTDSEGAEGKDSVDVFPETSQITLETDPPGLQIKFDGVTATPPLSVESVEGMLRSVEVITPQILNEIEYEFSSWSNDGDAAQTFATPDDDITITANFSVVVGIGDNQFNKHVTLLSNPSTNGQVNLKINTSRDQTATIRMTDVLASESLAAAFPLQNGDNIVNVPTGNLRAGLYLLTVEVDGKRFMRKVLVLK